jgi:hypothetical protein
VGTSISWDTQGTDLDPDSGDLIGTLTIHVLEFDAVTSESHEGASIATEHTVESGAPIVDHVKPLSRRVTLEAIVTNTPLGAPPSSGAVGSEITAQVQKVEDVEANVLVFSQEFDRVADVIAAIDTIRLAARLVTIDTDHRTYDSCIILRVTEPREEGEGTSSRRFQIEIQEIRVAESRTVDSPTPREPRASATSERGGQETTDQTRESSTIRRASDEYARRREAGESRTDAAMGAASAAFGG